MMEAIQPIILVLSAALAVVLVVGLCIVVAVCRKVIKAMDEDYIKAKLKK